MPAKQKIIIYLDRQKFILASTTLAAPLTLDIPASVLFDVEVIDPDSLNHLLTEWLEKNHIVSTDVIFVLSSNVYFQKDLAATSDVAARKSQSDVYLANVPFKNLFSKEYVLGNQVKLLAVNKDFYEPILRYFKSKNYEIIDLLPVLVLDFLKLNLVEYTAKEVNNIYQKVKILAPYSLISAQEIDKTMSAAVYHPPENKARKLILISIFCFLLVALLALLYLRPRLYKPTPAPVRRLPTPVVTQVPEPSPAVESVSLPSSVLTIDQVRVKILNSSGIPNQAAKIRDALEAAGFTAITTATSGKVIGAKNQINYRTSVSADILDIVKNTVTGFSGESGLSQVEALSDTDILITLVQKSD